MNTSKISTRRYFLIIMSLASCFYLIPAGAAEQEIERNEPFISITGSEPVLHLTEAQTGAIKHYDPTFKLRNRQDYTPDVRKYVRPSAHQILFAVIGDFNGDGKKDVVLQGNDDSNELLIAVLSTKEGPRVIDIYKRPFPEAVRNSGINDMHEDYLSFVPKRKVSSPLENTSVQLKTDAFEVIYFEKASTMYYYDGDKFQTYMTGD